MPDEDYADLYLRLSHAREGSTAIERQEIDCREWAARNGLIVRETHVDRGRSGYKEGVERAGFDAAIAATTSGVVGTLIVWKLDRLSRQGMSQVGLVLDQLDKVGGRLVSVKDGLDSSMPDSRSVIEMVSELARAESANLSLRVRSAKEHMRASGRWIGGQTPYGLLAVDGRLHVDSETGPIVREIARRVLGGSSLTTVTLWLNAEEIPSPRGKKWSIGSVAQLLRGPATAGLLPETVKRLDGAGYTGIVRPWRDPGTGGTVSIMADGQEPLITPADQDRIAQVLSDRTHLTPMGSAARIARDVSRYLLTGLLRCASCGNRMSRQGNSYRCQTARLGRTCEAPGGAYMRTLDEEVTRAWVQRLTTAEPDSPLLQAVADRWLAQHQPETSARRASVLAALERETTALTAIEGDRDAPRSDARESVLRAAGALARRVEMLQRALASNPAPKAEILALLDPTRVQEVWNAAEMEQRRELLRLALNEVRVSQGVRGQRFDPSSRLTFVWASLPPGVTSVGS